jgi:hypothetical protein
MSDQTWTKTTSGAVLDCDDIEVGTADGAGTITITHASNVQVNGGTLTIGPGVTVKFPSGVRILMRGGGLGAGVLDVNGTEDEPVRLTSAESPQAQGDWDGIEFGATSGAAPAGVLLDYTIIEYSVSGILCLSSSEGHDVLCQNCTFQHISQSHIQQQLGSSDAWTVDHCVFSKCPLDQSVNNALITSGSDGTLLVDNCSIYAEYNINNNIPIFNPGSTSTMTLVDTIAVGTNNDAGGDCTFSSTAGGATLNSSYTWRVVDDDGDFSPSATDIVKDPLYADTDCSGDNDLTPALSTGADTAGSTGGLIGALPPIGVWIEEESADVSWSEEETTTAVSWTEEETTTAISWTEEASANVSWTEEETAVAVSWTEEESDSPGGEERLAEWTEEQN